MPHVQRGQQPVRVPNATSKNPYCSPCNPPLLFTQGAPVIGGLTGTPGHVTITPIYWAPTGYAFTPTYKAVVNGYLANVAQDSRKNTNVFSAATQYYQQDTTPGAPVVHIDYVVAAGAELDDSSAYPTPGCTPAAGFTACVTDAQLQTEVRAQLSAAGRPIDDSHTYLVFFPPAVDTCFLGAGNTLKCSDKDYCAYHNATSASPYLVYANQPYPDLQHCSDPLNGPQSPNGDAEADASVSLVSHEANEVITDWAGAWMDSATYENGDECAYVFGTPQGLLGAYFNQIIGTGHYYTQDEFSNEDFALGIGDKSGATVVPGCVQREELPTAAFSGPSTIDAGASATFDGSASSDPDNPTLTYSWSWGDGTPNGSGVTSSHTYITGGTYTVVLTVADPNGWQGSARHPIVVIVRPVVTGVSPAMGVTSGHTSVTISGSSFTGVTSVKFGATDATTFTFVSDQQITAVTPAEPQGTVDVTVTTPAGTSVSSAADRYSFVFSGMYTLDGFGGMQGDDSQPVATTSYWPGWNIARSARAWPRTGVTQQGFVLDGWGGLHPYGPAGLSETSGTSGHYWPGTNIARDFAFLPDGSGGLVLDGYGGLHPFAVNGGAAPQQAVGNSYWSGWDIARKVVIFPDGSGGYVLDAFGGLHPFGIGQPPAPTVTNLQLTSYFGWNIARDVVLIPGDQGHSGYVLDGFGGLHPFHPTGDGSSMPAAVTVSAYWSGWDIARGAYFLPGSAGSGYTLDGYGGVHPFGGAPNIANHPYWPGWDIAKAICGA